MMLKCLLTHVIIEIAVTLVSSASGVSASGVVAYELLGSSIVSAPKLYGLEFSLVTV